MEIAGLQDREQRWNFAAYGLSYHFLIKHINITDRPLNKYVFHETENKSHEY